MPHYLSVGVNVLIAKVVWSTNAKQFMYWTKLSVYNFGAVLKIGYVFGVEESKVSR